MHWIALAALLAAPFWESKPAANWTTDELQQMFTVSPWARNVGQALYLASARPLQLAEEEEQKRSAKRRTELTPAEEDYRDYLRENAGKHLIVAIRVPDITVFSEARETKDMDKHCILRTGKRKIRMTGHFPPTPNDPVLRLLFPRELDPSAKSFVVSVYLPGNAKPFRDVEFFLNELQYQGKLEY